MRYLLIALFYFISANASSYLEWNTGAYTEQRDEPNRMHRAVVFFSKDAVVADLNAPINKNFRKFLKTHVKYFYKTHIICDTTQMLGGYMNREKIEKARYKEVTRILDTYTDILDYSAVSATGMQVQGYPEGVNACEVVLVKETGELLHQTDTRGFVK